jgi:hypothetical protein
MAIMSKTPRRHHGASSSDTSGSAVMIAPFDERKVAVTPLHLLRSRIYSRVSEAGQRCDSVIIP